MKENKSIIDVARANKLGIKLELVIIAILTVCYLIQGAKNSITTVGLAIILLTLWIPFGFSSFMFKKMPSSGIIKHIIGLGYGAFYITVCIISDQQLVFTYAFPMLIVCAIYCDLKFSISVGTGVCLISIIHGVVTTAHANFSPTAIAALEIQVAATILIAVYSALGNKFIIDITQENLEVINEANEKTEKMLSNIMEMSNTLADEVTDVSDKMILLDNSSQEIYTAMQEVSSGSNETAESVQNQLMKTEEIQNQVTRVSEASSNIANNVDAAVEAIHEGRDNIAELISQSKASGEAGNNAMKEVEELAKSTNQMHEIVELIKNVATQTSLLSLNASIEAARAGEAGRGFAVVASEISNLAGQTQTATGNISDLIDGLSKEMQDVVEAINTLVESNRKQNESANITAGSFEKIVVSTREIRSSSNDLASVVTTLADANQEIVESIQTISAITEEVSAHSNTTCESSEQNKAIVEEVMGVVEAMKDNADKLKNIQ